MQNYSDLEKKIGYTFKDKSKLDIAFTHTSYANENMVGGYQSYERYEYLGDSILEYISSEFLFYKYPEMNEGELTKLRASLVCEFTLSKITRDLDFGKYLKLSKGENLTGGRNRDSILCDLFESVLGAIYLDGGMNEAKKYVLKLLLNDIENKQKYYDSKTALQEYFQKRGQEIRYEIISEDGPEHNKHFVAAVYVEDKEFAQGEGYSKKKAEQRAAVNALEKIDKMG